MAATLYHPGMDLLRDWESGDYRFLLLQGSGYTPNLTHQYVSSLTPGTNEVSVANYLRATVSNPSRSMVAGGIYGIGGLRYDCDDPSFGQAAAGQSVTGIVLYKHVTNDSDSLLVAHYDLAAPTTGDTFTVQIPISGVVFRRQGSLI